MEKTRILFLASSPRDMGLLRVDQELREIMGRLRSSAQRDKFDIETRLAVRASDLQVALLENRPAIVHFSGHGGAKGIVFESEAGESVSVSADALAGLFEILATPPRCVVLNACYSEALAEALTRVVDCVVGISASIEEDAANTFLASFYHALAFGRSMSQAFQLGRNAISLVGLAERDTPTLHCGRGVDPRDIVFATDSAVPAPSPQPSDERAPSAAGVRTLSYEGYVSRAERVRSGFDSPTPGARIFCVSTLDDRTWLDELEKHMTSLVHYGIVASFLSEFSIPAGENVDATIEREIDASDVVLLLVTVNFVASARAQRQMMRALDRHAKGLVRVVPILVRPVYVEGAPWSGLQVLPRDGKPITAWNDFDAAWLDTVNGIRSVITYGLKQQSTLREPEGGDQRPIPPVSLPSRGDSPSPSPRKILFIGDIFSTTGQPDVTFVEPAQLKELRVFIKMMGKGLVVEGPSGIGKTTAVRRAVEELGGDADATWIRGSDETEVTQLGPILSAGFKGHLIIDDFHRLDDAKKAQVASRMKADADKSRRDAKITVIGVNPVGASLVVGFPDLAGRFEIISMGKQPDGKIEELISKGEHAANITLSRRDEFINAAAGSFYTAQELCFRAALAAGIEETQRDLTEVRCGPRDVLDDVMKSLNFRYRDTLSAFGSYDGVVAGRGACLLLLWLLSEEPDGCICIRDARRRYPGLAQTFDWLEAGHLARSFEEIRGLAGFLFYNERAGVLSVEDPQLEFYLRNLGWVDFAKRNGHSVRIHPKRGLIFEEPE